MNGMATCILACEREGLTGGEIAALIAPARDLHGEAPFIRRMQVWPRGYPGDFETIEQLVNWRADAEPDTAAYYIECVALGSGIAQQHRNKVDRQAKCVLEVVRHRTRPGRPVKILSIACGGSPDLRSIEEWFGPGQCSLFLNDLDPDALVFSAEALEVVRPTLVEGSVFEAMRKLRDHGPYDLVLMGGLADYLGERALLALVRNVRQRLLAHGGVFFFTNIAAGNPYRGWLQHVASWHLIERTEEDLLRLLGSAGFPADHVSLSREGTGLSLLVTAHAPHAVS
jgi:SAM-dependent methyltransferase